MRATIASRCSKTQRYSTPSTLMIVCLFTLACTAAFAQEQSLSHRLIIQPVNESQRTALKGNTHPLAIPEFDLGTAATTLPVQRMLLVLKRSSDQELALRKLLDD